MNDQTELARIITPAVQAIAVALIGAISGIVVAKINAGIKRNQSDPTNKEEPEMKDKRSFRRAHMFRRRIAAFIGAALALVLFGAWHVFDGQATKAPFCLDNYFYPSGWMGDAEKGTTKVELNDQWTENCHTVPCIRVQYRPNGKGWAGVYWQYPDGNWGEKPGRRIENAKKVVFWARGQTGAELVTFKVGGIHDKKYQDSLEKALGPIPLQTEWQRYEIDISGVDTSSVIGAFAWTVRASGRSQEITFYLDDICFQ